MKKLTLILALLCGAVYAEPAPGAPPTAKTDNAKLTSDELTTTIKERDALKVELATVKQMLENTKKESQAFIQSFQEQVRTLSDQLATSQANLKLTTAALAEAQKPKS